MALRPYDPVGAMGGLFAPAMIRGNRESELAFDEWMARNLKRPPAPDAPPAPPAPTMEGTAPESAEEAAARQRDAIARTILMLQGGDQGGGGGVDTAAPLDPNLDVDSIEPGPFQGVNTPEDLGPVIGAPVSTPVSTPVTAQPTQMSAKDQEHAPIDQTPPPPPATITTLNVTPVMSPIQQDPMAEQSVGKGNPLGAVPTAMPTAQEMQFGTQMQLALDPNLGGKIGAPQSQSERDTVGQQGPPAAPAPVAAPEAPGAPSGRGGIGSDPSAHAAAVAAAVAAAAGAPAAGPPGAIGAGSPLAGPAQSYGGFGPASSGPAAASAMTSNAYGLGGLMSGTPGVSSTGHIGTTGMGLLSGFGVNSGQTTPAPDPGLFGMAFGTAPPGSPSGGFTVGQAPSGDVFGGNPYGGAPTFGAPEVSLSIDPGGYDAYGGGYNADSPYGGGYGGSNSSGFGAEANAAVDAAQAGTGTGFGASGGTDSTLGGGYGGNSAAVDATMGGYGLGGNSVGFGAAADAAAAAAAAGQGPSGLEGLAFGDSPW